MGVTNDVTKLDALYQNDKICMKVKLFEKNIVLRTASLSSCSPILISVSVKDVCWRHLLEGRGDVLVTAVDELATGDIIRDIIQLSPP